MPLPKTLGETKDSSSKFRPSAEVAKICRTGNITFKHQYVQLMSAVSYTVTSNRLTRVLVPQTGRKELWVVLNEGNTPYNRRVLTDVICLHFLIRH